MIYNIHTHNKRNKTKNYLTAWLLVVCRFCLQIMFVDSEASRGPRQVGRQTVSPPTASLGTPAATCISLPLQREKQKNIITVHYYGFLWGAFQVKASRGQSWEDWQKGTIQVANFQDKAKELKAFFLLTTGHQNDFIQTTS